MIQLFQQIVTFFIVMVETSATNISNKKWLHIEVSRLSRPRLSRPRLSRPKLVKSRNRAYRVTLDTFKMLTVSSCSPLKFQTVEVSMLKNKTFSFKFPYFVSEDIAKAENLLPTSITCPRSKCGFSSWASSSPFRFLRWSFSWLKIRFTFYGNVWQTIQFVPTTSFSGFLFR